MISLSDEGCAKAGRTRFPVWPQTKIVSSTNIFRLHSNISWIRSTATTSAVSQGMRRELFYTSINVTLQKTGKWNAMHVRIAWEIYNHQQKARSDAKSSVSGSSNVLSSSNKLGQHSFDLLNKTPGLAPGPDHNGKRPGPPQELLRSSSASQGHVYPPVAGSVPGFPPRPPTNPYGLDPFGAHQRYFGAPPIGETEELILRVVK